MTDQSRRRRNIALDAVDPRIARLRSDAVRLVREERFESAIQLYDAGLTLATDEGDRELLVIGKADALL